MKAAISLIDERSLLMEDETLSKNELEGVVDLLASVEGPGEV